MDINLKMLFMFFLVTTLAASTLISAVPRNPLCKHAMAGGSASRRSSNGILSITWRGTLSLDFVLADSTFVKVMPSAIDFNHIRIISEEQFHLANYNSLLYDIWKLPRNGQLKAFYELCSDEHAIQHRCQVIIDQKLYIFNSDTNRLKSITTSPVPNPYSVVFAQWHNPKDKGLLLLSGAVIMKDILHKTDHLVIMDLDPTKHSLQPKLHLKAFYYLTADASFTHLILVHPNVVHNSSSSMDNLKSPFSSDHLPIGFINHKFGWVHLFDDHLGCVRIINILRKPYNWTAEYYKGTAQLSYRMENVPYERYFWCPEEKFTPAPGLDSRRCDRDPGAGDAPTVDPNCLRSCVSHNLIPPMAAASLLLGIFIGFAICFYFVKNSAKKNSKKKSKSKGVKSNKSRSASPRSKKSDRSPSGGKGGSTATRSSPKELTSKSASKSIG